MPTKTWIATTASFWNTAASWSPSGVPGTTDDVIFNGSANGNCTLQTSAGNCRSLVMTGYTGTFTFSVGMTVSGSDDGTATGNSLVLAASPASYAGTSTITLTSTYGGKITCNSNTLSNSLTINGVGGTFTLTDTLNIVSTRTLTITAGGVTGTNASVGLVAVTANANVKNITLTNLTANGVGVPFNVAAGGSNYTQSITNLYIAGTAAGTKQITMSGISGVTNLYFSCTGAGTDNIGFTANDGVCTNLYFTGTNTGCQISSRGCAVSGNMDFGTSSISWVTTGTNYTFSVGGNLIFSPNMTITTTANLITLNGTGNQNVTMNGKTFSAPFSVNKASGTATFLDAANFSGTFTNTTGTTVFNSTLNSTANITVTAGSFTFNDNATTTGTLTLTAGTLTALKNVTVGVFSSAVNNVRTINMGTGTWTLTTTLSTIAWNMGGVANATNATLNAGTSRILINSTTASTPTFSGSGLTYYILEVSRGASTNGFVLNGNGTTFANFIDSTATAHTITVESSATFNFHRFNVRGSAGALISFARSSTTTATFNKVGQGPVCCDYLTLGAGISNATPANTWFRGANSTGGTNWVAGDCTSSWSPLSIGGVG